jgi:uncharacterized protein
MLGVAFFGWMCSYLKGNIKGVKIKLSVQTNGVLLNEEWADVFSKYEIPVGISIDGPIDVHNRNRVYSDGRGSYDDVVAAVRLAREKDLLFGTLSVIDPRCDPKEVYEHLRSLEIMWVDFLLPDCCYDNNS